MILASQKKNDLPNVLEKIRFEWNASAIDADQVETSEEEMK